MFHFVPFQIKFDWPNSMYNDSIEGNFGGDQAGLINAEKTTKKVWNRRWWQKICFVVGIIFCVLIAIEHVGFFVMESFLYNTTIGRRIFPGDPSRACYTFAFNQGVYNLFLSMGFLLGLIYNCLEFIQPHYKRIHAMNATVIKSFFLFCVFVAGLVGGISIPSWMVFIIQMSPPIIGFVFVIIGQ
jgi:uncharacterized membrane protein